MHEGNDYGSYFVTEGKRGDSDEYFNFQKHYRDIKSDVKKETIEKVLKQIS